MAEVFTKIKNYVKLNINLKGKFNNIKINLNHKSPNRSEFNPQEQLFKSEDRIKESLLKKINKNLEK